MSTTDKKLDTIIEQNKYIIERDEQTQKKLDGVLETLNGNGKPGLKTRVALLEKGEARNEKWRWAIITGMFGILFASLKDTISSWFS